MISGCKRLPPTVGVVIVNWNSFFELRHCLAALAAVRGEFRRVVIIDNCSRSAPEALDCVRPPNTEYIRLDSNTGFARGNNLALPYLEDCDWIALINPDAYVDAGWLQAMAEAIPRYSDCAMFASRLIKANKPELLDGVGDCFHVSGMAWRHGHGARVADVPIADREVFAPCAAAALYRRDALLEQGGFDESYFCYFEDVDLAFRLRLAGHKCMLVSDAVAYHVGSATTGGQRSDFAVYHGHRNMVWCYVKNMPALLFWLCLPLHLCANIMAVVRFALRGQGGSILRAKRDALRGIPANWVKRRQVQARRVVSTYDVWRALEKSVLPRRN
ncbi:MAG: glycosyltransferase family 2 protein [Rhodocyclaceae bacterium]